MSARLKEHPKWINPCGFTSGSIDFDHNNPSLSQVSDLDLLQQIVSAANLALVKANQFKETFAQATFSMTFDRLHKLMQNQYYDWLQKMPKNLGEKTSHEYLKSLEFDETLLDAYLYLQTLAVGLEQITWDQLDKQGQFAKEFKETEDNLRIVLCELQSAMAERGMTMRPDVNRDAMKDDYRNMDSTDTKQRDWIIFRDYMNTLEYLVDAFSYIKEKISH